jgi:phosphoribosyl-AMP cyclohydrolase
MTIERATAEPAADFVRFGSDGLISAVLQDAVTRRVLMVGFMNAAALAATQGTGLVHFWSRSRKKLWQKGETSGNVSRVVEMRVNCEQNSLLLLVEQAGAICHDGYPTCYYRRVDSTGTLEVVESRNFDPAEVYGEPVETKPRPLKEVISEWYSAYRYLHEHDLGAESSTSRRLRSGEDLRGRVADELDELAGVLDGTHRHENFATDVALEAGQVLYWLTLVAVSHGLPEGELRLAATVEAPGTSSVAGLAGERLSLAILAAVWAKVPPTELIVQIQVTVATLARACRLAGIDVRPLIEDDLRSLASRTYLVGYFVGDDSTPPSR